MRLAAPKGHGVRPTLDRVREALFNILAPRIAGACFLDLFAGTGANGIEALSRGALSAVFVDKEVRSLSAVRANLATTRLAGQARIMKLAIPVGLAQLDGPFDVIFADPPYEFRDFEALFGEIQRRDLLNSGGIIVLEHASRTPLEELIGGFSRTRQATYGDTTLSFFS